MDEVAPGLRRWTAWHEEWEEHVGSLAVETDDGLVLIDPLDPPREVGAPDHVLVTVYWHGRQTKELRARRVWASTRSAQPLSHGKPVLRNGNSALADVLAFETRK